MNYNEAVTRCWLEVDLDVIRENYRSALKILGDNMLVIPVLKANAYGMGAPFVAEALKQEGVRMVAVAAPVEAIQIANKVSGLDILTMGLSGIENARLLIERNMILTMYSEENGIMLCRAAAEVGKMARVHIKIDTGLHRIGFDPNAAADRIEKILQRGNLEVEGLFTHLAIHSAEMDVLQMNKLEEVHQELEKRGIHIPMIHAMDSIGMVRYSRICRNVNAVRIGAWLYGVEPKGNTMETPICPARFCARVSQVRSVAKGELVGYDDQHPLLRDSIIATVAAGYIDGTPRVGNNWMVEIKGKRAPVIGIACMDQLMCDVTDIPSVEEGEIVTFCGGIIANEEYSRMGGLNRNEAWARIGVRVPRVYYENGTVSFVDSEMIL